MTKIGCDNSNTEREIQSLIVWINHTENITLLQKSKTHENTTQPTFLNTKETIVYTNYTHMEIDVEWLCKHMQCTLNTSTV